MITRSNTAPALAEWVSGPAREHFSARVEGVVAPPGTLAETRTFYEAVNSARVGVAQRTYDVAIEDAVFGGVPVAVVTPTTGVVDRGTLLCLHGGAFMWGAGAGALIEAIPIAAVARRRVVAVDYRLAPEHLFPAAVDDVLGCYHAILNEQPASSIGLYGCSAGGVLTAQAIARLIRDDVPLPGAIAMLHATGLELGGDSLAVAPLLNGVAQADIVPSLAALPFLAETDARDPLVFPGDHPEMLARFAPTLLVSGTRDFAASSLSVMHRRLRASGAEADLVIFDGLWHAHHVDSELPEARETFDIMARFFAKHLADV